MRKSYRYKLGRVEKKGKREKREEKEGGRGDSGTFIRLKGFRTSFISIDLK